MQSPDFDWSIEKCYCQINVVGRYVFINKMIFFYLFPRCSFLEEVIFTKAIENFFPVFVWPGIRTRGVGRTLNSYTNPRLRLGFA